MSKIVIGVFNDSASAGVAVKQLRAANFAASNISLLGRDIADDMRPIISEVISNKPDRLMTDLGIAGAIGGFLIGLTAVTIPGTGAVLIAGPLIAAVSGAAAGSALGVVAGALVHFDVPVTDARIYETHLTMGKVLIAVHVNSPAERIQAEELLDGSGALEVDTKAA